MGYVLIGAGGHAKVIIDILKANKKEIIGLLDDHSKQSDVMGYPILGTIEEFPVLQKKHSSFKCMIAIGNNKIREMIAGKLEKYQPEFGLAVHPSAIIGSELEMGEGTVVMPNVVINACSKIGKHCIINTGSTVDHDCNIHHFVHISPGAHLAGNISVGKGSQVGIGASVIPGMTIGEYATVGAGATVVKPVEPNVTVVGTPAKVLKLDR